MKNPLILWIALGSLFLNIGVVSAAGFVIWQNWGNPAGEEDGPWAALEESGFDDNDWANLDALLESRDISIDELVMRMDEQTDFVLEQLWEEDIRPEVLIETFNQIEDERTALSRALFEDFVGYLATLPLDKRGALMELLFEGEDFVLWPL